MLDFVEKLKKNYLPLTLIVLYVVFIIVSWGRWGHVMSDSFREAIIPQALLDGKILYRDILNLYPPLAYQLNALLFKFFGSDISVLYLAGIVCGAVNLTLLYKLVKHYFSDITAFVTTLTIMELLTFRICINNSASWFFPYSYSFLYAFTTCFAALVIYLLYKNFNSEYTENTKKSEKSLYLISILTGLSVAFKWDFCLFALVPLFEAIKNKSVRQFLICTGLLICPSLLTFTIFLLTGGTINDLANEVNFLVNFSHAPSVIAFNLITMPQSITPKVLRDLFFSLFIFIKHFAVIGIISYVVCKFIERNVEKKWLNVVVTAVTLILGFFCILKPFSVEQFNKLGIQENIVFVPYFLVISAICILSAKRFSWSKLLPSEKFYITLIILGFLITGRQYAEVKISYIGNFTVIPFWTAFVCFCIELLPNYFKKLQEPVYRKTIIASLILFCSLISLVYFSYFFPNMKYKINSPKAAFYTGVAHTRTLNDALSYIKNNIPEDKTLLVMEEGLLLNWFSGRKTNLKYYALIPHMIDTIGEQKIIEDLSADMPDYIMITSNEYPFVGCFGIQYAKEIIQFVFENYDYEKSIVHSELKKSLEITIFKKKQQPKH